MGGEEGKNMFVTGVINVDLWNQAGWKAVVFGFDPSQPPLLGLAFQNKRAAEQIFQEWRKNFGEVDANEEIRISIIEGEIPGEESGYTVHINTNVEGLLKRTEARGLDVSKDMLAIVSRYHRMNPDKNSRNLENFKAAYAKARSYYLVPCVYHPNGQVELMMELAIGKRNVEFRKVEDIAKNDQDIVAITRD